ncbi:MAG: hypothetical protein H7320_15090 [Ferruginibacter sp.]|nr:hypothetical protein [Ferruginibacter sp.]
MSVSATVDGLKIFVYKKAFRYFSLYYIKLLLYEKQNENRVRIKLLLAGEHTSPG